MQRVSSVTMPIRFEASARSGSSGSRIRSTTNTLMRAGFVTPERAASAMCRGLNRLPCFRTNSSCFFAHCTAIGSNFSNAFGSTTTLKKQNACARAKFDEENYSVCECCKCVIFRNLSGSVHVRTENSGGNFFRMIFGPVTNRSAHGHVARVGRFVTIDIVLTGAVSQQVRMLKLGESRSELFFVVAGANPISKPFVPAHDPFVQKIEMFRHGAGDFPEMGEIKIGGV